MMQLAHTWYKTINEIGRPQWDGMFASKSIVQGYLFSKAVESAALEDVHFHYLVVRHRGAVCAIVPCFTYRVKLEILAGNSIKSTVEVIRKVFPKFFRTSLFVVGSPVATCEYHMGILEDDAIDLTQLGTYIDAQVQSRAVSCRSSLTLVKEIPHAELSAFKATFGDRFHVFESLANSYVPVLGNSHPYPSMLKKSYRQRFKKAINESDKNGHVWSFVQPNGVLAKQMHALYLNVYEKSPYKFEKLTLGFFESVFQLLPANSFLLVCKDTKGALVCAELILEDDKSLIPMYLGLDYALSENSAVYFNVIFRTIMEAEKREKEWVVLGQTSYEPKAYSGASFERVYLGIDSQKPFMRFLIKHVFKYLFPQFIKPNAHPVKEEVVADVAYRKRCEEVSKIFE